MLYISCGFVQVIYSAAVIRRSFLVDVIFDVPPASLLRIALKYFLNFVMHFCFVCTVQWCCMQFWYSLLKRLCTNYVLLIYIIKNKRLQNRSSMWLIWIHHAWSTNSGDAPLLVCWILRHPFSLMVRSGCSRSNMAADLGAACGGTFVALKISIFRSFTP